MRVENIQLCLLFHIILPNIIREGANSIRLPLNLFSVARVTNYDPLPDFVNKILWKIIMPLHLPVVYGCFHIMVAELTT